MGFLCASIPTTPTALPTAHVRVGTDVLVAVVACCTRTSWSSRCSSGPNPQGRKAFGLKREFAEETKALAANQGLANGFLVAGLAWGLVAVGDLREPVLVFFLLCVVLAGGYGAATVNRRVLVVQALPAMLALGAVLISW